jgi:hypothetical protein
MWRGEANMTYLKAGINKGKSITCIMSWRNAPLKSLSTAESCLQHVIIYCRLYNSIFRAAQEIFRTQYTWKKDSLWYWDKSNMLHIWHILFISMMEPVFVHWKTAAFIMTLIKTMVDKIIHYLLYMIYSNCNMNEWIQISMFPTITNLYK